jgi:hypothetical protein
VLMMEKYSGAGLSNGLACGQADEPFIGP